GLLLSFVPVSYSQHTMVVCGGGGLNKYQSAAPDCLQPPLLRRCGFRQQVSASVRQLLEIRWGHLSSLPIAFADQKKGFMGTDHARQGARTTSDRVVHRIVSYHAWC